MAVIVPTLRWERPLWRDGATRIAGVDEVGVAPTCGAVVAAAVIMSPNCHRIPGVRDSKTLSAAQRERLAPIIRRRAVAVGLGAASVADIDRLNIYHATHLAMRRAIARARRPRPRPRRRPADRGLRGAGRAVHGDRRRRRPRVLDRVRVGRREGRPRPDDAQPRPCATREYGWDRNAGYATREHRDAIRAHGLTPHHRKSWQALQVLMAGDQLGLFDADEAVVDELGDADLVPAVRAGEARWSRSRWATSRLPTEVVAGR